MERLAIEPKKSYYNIIASDSKLLCLFEHMVNETKDVLLPSFDPQFGYVYKDIIKSCNASPKDSVEIINKIISFGLGTKEYHDQVLRCPYCASELIQVRFYCPFCNSTQLYKELLIEHIRDGVIGPISKFKDASGALVCPSCGSKLLVEGRDYRNVGIWYRCLSCYRQMDNPKIIYHCMSCGKDVTAHGLVISSLWRIILNKAALEEFSRQHLIIRPILDILSEAGYVANAPGSLSGKSGASHSFDVMGIDKTGNTIIVDTIVSKEPVDVSAVMNLFVKILDTSPTKSILVCVPSITESAKKLASLYGIIIVEAKSPNDIITPLKSIVSSKMAVSSEKVPIP